MSLFTELKALKPWQWQQGRQESGYKKMFIVGLLAPIPFDVYLLKYNQGSFIPPHVDPVAKGKHFRINIVLKKAECGGEFICDNTIVNLARLKIFRSDIAEHAVTEIKQGTRYVLSFGMIL